MLSDLIPHYPTPFFAYDAAIVRARAAELRDAFKALNVKLYYAIKANDNPAVVALVAQAGIGGCLVSRGEMLRAEAGGMQPADMLMNGVGKTDDEIEFALSRGVGQLNIEALPEVGRIAAIARKLGVRAVVCVRINPEVTAVAHSHTTTARRTDKFGLLIEELPQVRALIAQHPELDWRGFSCHIGSQIHGVEELAASYRVMTDLYRAERATQPQFDRLDLGGGFGVSYKGDSYARPADYAALVAEVAGDLMASGTTIQLEPGRFLVAEAGNLLTRVIQVKDSGGTRFVVIDAAMNNLIRPALYDAYHPIVPTQAATTYSEPCTVVGPVCESADCFGRGFELPADIKAGDVLAIGYAGAYGAAMSSQYNARDRLAEVLVDGAQHRLIRRAMTAQELDDLTLVDASASPVRARA